MLGIIRSYFDASALNRAYILRGEQRFDFGLSVIVQQYRKYGREFPSSQSSPRALALAASLNYHLKKWDDVIIYCNTMVDVFSQKINMSDMEIYLCLYVDELARSCKDHSQLIWLGPSVDKQVLDLSELSIPKRYSRYFPLLEDD